MDVEPGKLREFTTKISRYFLNFLETDFHRQQAPRRRIQLKSDTNQTTGVPLRKYETLYRAIINLLSREVSVTGARVLNVPRGRYKAALNPVLRNLINQQIDAIEPEKFKAIIDTLLETAREKRSQAAADPEAFHHQIISVLEQSTCSHLVHPLLAVLEQPLQTGAYSAIESAFEIETDLTAILTHALAEQLPAALNTLVLGGGDGQLQKTIADFFNETQAREQLKSFFDGFAAADAWQEIRDLYGLTRLGDNLQVYLYLCDLRFGNSLYPLIYLPVTITQEEQSNEFHLELDSHLYVNKRAVDYVAQELDLPVAHCAMYGVDDRIVYLDPGAAPVGQIEKVLARLQSLFDFTQELKLTEQIRAVQSSRVRLSTAAYFTIFDRSDEALLNDYEALLTELNSGQPEVGAMFEKIVHGLIFDDPFDASLEVGQAWDDTPIPFRLVTESPIPLNEEQRKILAALNNPKVNYVSVEGPPGTGKSHTITAIAFEAILSGKTVLILSDKIEALDVVEDKLTKAINRVRPDANFRNPILRLGRTAGTYTKLLSHASVETIEDQFRAARARQKELDENIHAIKERLIQNIGGTIQQLTSIKLADIETFQKLEAAAQKYAPELVAAIEKGPCPDLKEQLEGARAWRKTAQAEAAVAFLENANPATVGAAIGLMRKSTLGSALGLWAQHRNVCSIFRTLRPSDGKTLQQFVARYDALRIPVFGYLFRKGKIRALNRELGKALDVVNFVDLHRRLEDLRFLCDLLPKGEAILRTQCTSEDEFAEVYEEIIHHNRSYPDFRPLLQLIKGLGRVVAQWELQPLASWTIGKDGRFARSGEFIAFCFLTTSMVELWLSLTAKEVKVPKFDLVAERDQLEQLCAAKMTFAMDNRFLNFVKQSAATAKTLNAVIRTRQKFPTDTFERLRDAFPCIIAGIREFAECIPLKQDIFDLVVIDEASQVSVAQAFPALLRAKKAVVLGDKQQFSNVKSAYASNERNTAYISDIKDYFRSNISRRAELLVRVSQFDVKKSILEFFELIRNFEIMLRKHFRGYQELISFSSEYFYGGRLQAVKFRGKPIDEVIKFTILDHDGRPEKFRNANSLEAEFTLKHLEQFLEEEHPPTVGVITPFREQVALLSKMVLEQPNARDYQDVLKLKIMTFDTCQGEERQVIFYSMVARKTQDTLNYVLPVNLADAGEKVADQIKFQRLNVGLSRAQDCVHFVLSKPIEEYSGSARTVLQHYRRILDDKCKADPDGTDPKSPMERKLLGWLEASQFYQKNREDIELRTQFRIGDYLHQLDPTYHHPKYRTDFLLIYHAGDQILNIVIEYDGFEFHFVEQQQVNRANWAFYYRPEDIERQATLETYGYKFLRVNRFNLGADPPATLSERLYNLVGSTRRNGAAGNHVIVSRIQKDARALADGDKRYCAKCERTRPAKDFFDHALKKGAGGYGRYCRACKGRNSLRLIS
jgi:hypothetical protein